MAEFPLPREHADPFLCDAIKGRHRRILVSADNDRRIRGAVCIPDPFVPFMGLAGGGPSTSDEQLVAEFEGLCSIARRLAPTIAYAYIEIQPTFWLLLAHSSGTEW
jgi:hypothetical protein